DLGEEPAAAGVHEHGVALDLQVGQGLHLFQVVQGPAGLFLQEVLSGSFRIQDQMDVVVTGGPGVLEELAPLPLEMVLHMVPQEVEGFTQGAAPLLGPAFLTTGLAAAITEPTAHAMGTTPGSAVPVLAFLD